MSTKVNKARLQKGLEEARERKRERLFEYLYRVGLATADQLARGWFAHHNDPGKRAREWLVELSRYGVLDIHYVPGQRNLYRLSREARKNLFHDESPVASFKMPKLEHRLAIGDVLLDMMQYDFPRICHVEYKQEYTFQGRPHRFRPDLILLWLHKWIIVEVQNSVRTSKKWADKWHWHMTFWESGAYKYASWQPEGRYVQPRIIVVSTQQPDTVTYGADPRLKKIEVVRSIHDSILVKELRP